MMTQLQRAGVLGLLLLLLCAALCSAAAAQDGSTGSPDRPRSVAFYLVDTCRHDRMSYVGYERATTPFLEWLAERSVVFEACYSQAAWTKPSMASMLSSQYPSTTGVYKMMQRLPESFLTWPEVLQASGMYTAGFSANIVMGNTLSNFAQGFDHFVESTQINHADPIRFASGSARKLNRRAFAWLDRTDHWPMLLYMHSVDPHEEYEPEGEYLKQFADPGRHERFREEWKQLLRSRPPIPGLFVTQDNFDRTRIDAASFIEHGSNLYDADVRANDDQMKLLWNKLKEDGWGDDFIFVFTSDHGEEFFDHGGTSHGYSLYDEMIRVPLMIYAPGLLPAGKRISTPVRSLDIYPTLCDLLGIDIPDGLEGESLVPLARGEAKRKDLAIISEHREDPIVRTMGQGSGVLVSVQRGKWKFILNQTSSQLIEKPRFELFDLGADPGETRNVADQHPDLVSDFESEVVDFISEHRKDASAEDWKSMDPEVLAQLRALGYIGDDEEAPAGGQGAGQTTGQNSGITGITGKGAGEKPGGSRVSKGLDPTAELFAAIAAGDKAAVERCIDRGASLKAWDPNTGWTPLSAAVFLGRDSIARLLLDKGAKVHKRNRDMGTTLHGAAVLGATAIVRLLVEHGADVDARDANGSTPLHAAAFLGRVESVTYLLEQDADPLMKDATGLTPRAVCDTDWPTTEMIMRMIGLNLERADVEKNRAVVARLLEE